MSAEDAVRSPSLKVHHLAVKVRDLARAESFYAGALGLPIIRRQDAEDGTPRSIWLSLHDGAFLAVERAEEPESQRLDGSPGWHCVALGIDASERETWRTRLTSRGHPVVRETAYTLYVRDPEGAIVALSHYPHAIAEAVVARGSQPPPAPGGPTSASAVEVGPDRALEGGAPSGVTSRLAALVTLSLALLALVGSAVPVSAQRAPADVLVVGSSSVFGPFGRLVEEQLEEAGLRVRRHSRRSTGFARPDFFDWQREIGRVRGLGEARAVVVMMGGNDTMALRLRPDESRDRGPASWVAWRDEARWRELYTSRVRAFVDTICDAGVARAIVVLPADGDREGWADRIARVQEAQAAGVRGTRCGVVLDPRSDAPVREGDTIDGVHLSTRGARQVLTRIGPALLAAIES
ncbi:VOC family protein [Sandaracinus amylolyticus]|uniref:DUF459 domain-containing protein n=1 Tax=Sandaracinus amylolyticus TaxID=927083 RepID=UPI001F31BB6D|nr:VOC family protein [Sandaracinus amylolyticus]UJR82771.1 Hypothetical protein I5071_48360 [Sandaracinus amylolyticus]